MKKNVNRKSVELQADPAKLSPNADGIDIGSASHFVAIPDGRDDE